LIKSSTWKSLLKKTIKQLPESHLVILKGTRLKNEEKASQKQIEIKNSQEVDQEDSHLWPN
jgi:3-phosphoglycerate kinase